MALIDPTETAACAGRSAAMVEAEITDAAHYSRLHAEWESLVTRAILPNVSMHPAVALAAADAGARTYVILAWRRHGAEVARELVGAWVLGVGRLHRRWPAPVLVGPADRNLILGVPVVDRAAVEDTLSAMLDAVAAIRSLPAILQLREVPTEGPLFEGLRRVLARRRSGLLVRRRLLRPKLTSRDDADGYLAGSLSAGRRAGLRRRRRRLGEMGMTEVTFHRTRQEVQTEFETFLALEASGWKGRAGTALARRGEGALAFVRPMIRGLADHGLVTIVALRLDGRAVAMEVLLRCGGVVHTWKCAYDESLRSLGPGFLLFEDLTRALLADPSLVLADMSNNREFTDPNGANGFWPERQEVADLHVRVRASGAVDLLAAGLATWLGRARRALAPRPAPASGDRPSTASR
ncbi:GNAT family N-acetyltransferase [Phenylobacterium sp.]|uniref:GNAT family N-acetyltransferase n=1 Tax=Phenylobacterium sp. TaxID=1871053 RepID=UPI002BB8FD69|nr:GNAT family N-acetyltransferase [Phenylobacterium sp.]HVI31069.1 GNAT family N-acetyltransferase [Phenylobacterium sp.]